MDGNSLPMRHPPASGPGDGPARHPADGGPVTRLRKWRVGAFLIVQAESGAPIPREPSCGRERPRPTGWIAQVHHERPRTLPAGGPCLPGRAFVTIAADGPPQTAGDGPCREAVTVVVPESAGHGLDAALADHGPGPIREPYASMLAAFLLPLAAALPLADREDLPLIETALRALLVMALRRAPGAGGGATRSMVLLRGRVEEVIARNLASARLDVLRIVELAGVSRTTLYRLFEADGGVAAYVQRLRLEQVRRDLCDPAELETPIARLAERRGLYCAASFNRAFRRLYGATPRQVRTAALARQALGGPARAEGEPC